jgi:hypothetical protein
VSALEKFKDWNLTFNKPATDQVELPSDITSVSSEQLGELMTRLTSWTDYINSQMTMAQLEERAALKKKDFTENTLLIRRMGAQVKGERVTTVKAEISVSPEVIQLDNDYEEKYAYRKLVEMLLTNHERDLQLVSREITRRQNENRRNI